MTDYRLWYYSNLKITIIKSVNTQLVKKRIESLQILLNLNHLKVFERLNKNSQDHRFISTFENTYRYALLGALASLFDSLGEIRVLNLNIKKIRNLMFHFPHEFEQFSINKIYSMSYFVYDKFEVDIPELFFVNSFNYLQLLEDGEEVVNRVANIQRSEETDGFLREQQIYWQNKLNNIVNAIQNTTQVLSIFKGESDTFKDKYIYQIQGNASAFYHAIQSGFASKLKKSENPESSELARQYLDNPSSKHRLSTCYRHNDNSALIFSNANAARLHCYAMFEKVLDNEKVEEFISEDCWVDFRNLKGESTILLLAKKKQWSIVFMLLDSGKTDLDINHSDLIGMNLLLTAACNNEEDVIKRLIDRYEKLDVNVAMYTAHNVLVFALHSSNMNLFRWYVSNHKVNNKTIYSTLRTLLLGGSGELEFDKCIEAIEFLVSNGTTQHCSSLEEDDPILYIGLSSTFQIDDNLWIKLLGLFMKHGSDINATGDESSFKRTTTFTAMNRPQVLTWILNQPECDLSVGGIHNYTIFEIDKYLKLCYFDEEARNAKEMIKSKISSSALRMA